MKSNSNIFETPQNGSAFQGLGNLIWEIYANGNYTHSSAASCSKDKSCNFRKYSSILIEPRMLKAYCKIQHISSIIISFETEWFEWLIVMEMNEKCQEILNFKCSVPGIRSDCIEACN